MKHSPVPFLVLHLSPRCSIYHTPLRCKAEWPAHQPTNCWALLTARPACLALKTSGFSRIARSTSCAWGKGSWEPPQLNIVGGAQMTTLQNHASFIGQGMDESGCRVTNHLNIRTVLSALAARFEQPVGVRQILLVIHQGFRIRGLIIILFFRGSGLTKYRIL